KGDCIDNLNASLFMLFFLITICCVQKT
ncbi:hypothetical protein EHRUM4_09980, partial [Ehrlichia ruminantium]